MRLVDLIFDLLAAGPMSAPELAARLRAAGHVVTDLDIRVALAPYVGVRVARDGGAWRLIDTTAGSSLAVLMVSGAAVSAGLRAQHVAGGALCPAFREDLADMTGGVK